MDYLKIYLVQYRDAAGRPKTDVIAAWDPEDLEEAFYKAHFSRDFDVIGVKREYVNF